MNSGDNDNAGEISSTNDKVNPGQSAANHDAQVPIIASGIPGAPVHVILSLPLINQPLVTANSTETGKEENVIEFVNVDEGTTDGLAANADNNIVLDTDTARVTMVQALPSEIIVPIQISGQSLEGIEADGQNPVQDSHTVSTAASVMEDIKSLSSPAPDETATPNLDLVPINYTSNGATAEIDGKQYYILADGVGAIPSGNAVEATEPPTKKIKVEGEDGQFYILTLAGDLQPSGDSQFSEHQYQAKQPEFGETEPKVFHKRDHQLMGSDVSQAWFTTRDDKNILQRSGHTWKQGQWTKEEVDLLQININEYCRQNGVSDPTEVIFEMSKDERKEFYRSVAKGLQRPLFSVYRRVTRMYDQKNHIGKYSPEEISRLRELRRKHGNDWATIGQLMGRSASSVKDKCRLMKDTCNSGKWLPEEEKRLTQAVYELTGCEMGSNVVHGLSWSRVAERVLTRSEKQCRTKWLNYMNWKQQGGKVWTREDDMNLIYRIINLNVGDDTEIDWTDLAKNWDRVLYSFLSCIDSVRSPQWLRGKWWSLKRHIQDYQLIPFSDLLESMKTFYLHNVRARSTILSTGKGKRLDNGMEAMAYIPISLTGDLSQESSSLGEIDNGVQAYEVLQQLPNSSASYIITQPSVTEASLNSPLSEHIIVQTLPISQGGDGDLELQNRVVIRVPSSSELNVAPLEPSDLGTSIHLTGPMDQEQTGFKMSELSEENGITHSDSLSDDPPFPSDNLESSVISSPSDVIGIKQSDSTSGRLMTSFSDPMLNSNSNSLMGPASDVDTDKPNPEDIIGNM